MTVSNKQIVMQMQMQKGDLIGALKTAQMPESAFVLTPKTTTTTTPTTTKSTSTSSKTSSSTNKQAVINSQMQKGDLIGALKTAQMPESAFVLTPKTTTTTTPTKPINDTKTIPVYNPIEQLIGKTNPDMAQKMYESRTGKTIVQPITEKTPDTSTTPAIVKTTTPTQIVVPPMLLYNPLEQMISKINPAMAYKMMQSRTGKGYNEQAVIQQAQQDIKPSIANKFNVSTTDYDYDTEIGRLSSDISSGENALRSELDWLKSYNTYESNIKSNISTIRAGSSDSQWEIDVNNDNKIDPDTEVFTSDKAVAFFEGQLSDASKTKRDVERNIPTLVEDVDAMKKSKIYLEEYQKKGYYLDVKDGEYYFSEPKASEVVQKIYGDRPDLYIASELRTLGFGVLLAGAQDLISGGGTKSLEANKEATAESILGATRLPDESIESHAVRFWTSPEAIADVWVPVATLGISKGITLAGRAVAPTVTRVGASLVSKAGPTTAKIISGAKTVGGFAGRVLSSPATQYTMKYGMYTVLEAPALIDVAQNKPEMFGSTLGKSLYRWEVTWTAMDVGFEGGFTKAKKQWVEEDIKATLNIPQTVQPQKTSGIVNIVQSPGKEGEMYFFAEGKALVKTSGEKPILVDIKAGGLSQQVEALKGVYSTESKGFAMYSFGETRGLTKYSYTQIRPIEGSAFDVLATKNTRLISSVERSMGNLEPTAGESFTKVARIGESQKGNTLQFYTSKGKYSNIIEDIMGDQRTLGFIVTKQEAKQITKIGEVGPGGSQSVKVTLKPKTDAYYKVIDKPGPGFKKTPWKYETKTVEAVSKDIPAVSSAGISERLTSGAGQFVKEVSKPSLVSSGGGLISGAKVTLKDLEMMEVGLNTSSSRWSDTKPSTGSMRQQVQRERQRYGSGQLQGITANQLEKETQKTGERTHVGTHGRGEIDILKEGEIGELGTGLTGLGTGINLGMKERTDIRTGIRESEGSRSDLAQSSRLKTAQLTRTDLAYETDLVTPTERVPTPVPPNIHIPGPRLPRRKPKEEPESNISKQVRAERYATAKPSKMRPKSLLSDLLSVTQSHARYGKATQPKLTKEVWARGERTMFKRVPTQEIMKGGRNKSDYIYGKKKKGGKKNVYY